MPINAKRNIVFSIDLGVYLQDPKPITFEGADVLMIKDRDTQEMVHEVKPLEDANGNLTGEALFRYWLTFSYRGADPQTGRTIPLSYKIKYWHDMEENPFSNLEGERVNFVNGIMTIGANGYVANKEVVATPWESYKFEDMVLASSKSSDLKVESKEPAKSTRFDQAPPATPPAKA